MFIGAAAFSRPRAILTVEKVVMTQDLEAKSADGKVVGSHVYAKVYLRNDGNARAVNVKLKFNVIFKKDDESSKVVGTRKYPLPFESEAIPIRIKVTEFQEVYSSNFIEMKDLDINNLLVINGQVEYESESESILDNWPFSMRKSSEDWCYYQKVALWPFYKNSNLGRHVSKTKLDNPPDSVADKSEVGPELKNCFTELAN